MSDEPSPFIEHRRRHNRFMRYMLEHPETTITGRTWRTPEHMLPISSEPFEMKKWWYDPPYGRDLVDYAALEEIFAKRISFKPVTGDEDNMALNIGDLVELNENSHYYRGAQGRVTKVTRSGQIHVKIEKDDNHPCDVGRVLTFTARKLTKIEEPTMNLKDKIKADLLRKQEAAPKTIHGFEVGAFVEVHNTGTIWDGTRGKVVTCAGASDVVVKVTWSKCAARREDGTCCFQSSWLRLVPKAFRSGFEVDAPRAYKVGDRVIGNEKSMDYKYVTGTVKNIDDPEKIGVLFDGQMYCTPMPLEAISPSQGFGQSDIPPGMPSVMVRESPSADPRHVPLKPGDLVTWTSKLNGRAVQGKILKYRETPKDYEWESLDSDEFVKKGGKFTHPRDYFTLVEASVQIRKEVPVVPSGESLTVYTYGAQKCRHHGVKIEDFKHTPISKPAPVPVGYSPYDQKEVVRAEDARRNHVSWARLEGANLQTSLASLKSLVKSRYREWPTCPYGKVLVRVDTKSNTGHFHCTCQGKGGT